MSVSLPQKAIVGAWALVLCPKWNNVGSFFPLWWILSNFAFRILNFFYKNVVPTGVLWWFQIYCGWSGSLWVDLNWVFIPGWRAFAHLSAFDYVYILLWNSIWTIAPVIGIGLFDRFLGTFCSWHCSITMLSLLDSHVLMQVPEIYHYGREGTWFGMRLFFVYMFDGLVQVSSFTRNESWLLTSVVCDNILLDLLYLRLRHLKGWWFWYRTNRVLNRKCVFLCTFCRSLLNTIIDDGYLGSYGC